MDSSDKGLGYNPLRWDCDKQGCFNIKKRPKIEVFSNCFPRKINFGDIDGIVEINRKGLILEWKENHHLPTGQRIMYERFTSPIKCPACSTVIPENMTVLFVVGNPETMECEQYSIFHKGKQLKPNKASLEDVKGVITRWAKHVIR